MMKHNKILSIHQPNYIPWLGYFIKIFKSDYFVILDVVQYPRGNSFAARNKIKTSNGVTFLTIPVSIPKGENGKVQYTDVKFANTKWKRKHLRSIEMNYKKTKYYDEIFSLYKNVIDSAEDFTEMNIELIEQINKYLNIDTKIIRLSELLDVFGKKTQLIIDICNKLNANIYLSGTGGGKDYNNEELLNKNSIKLTYNDFKFPIYSQLWGNFKSHLSIIDLLFNEGNNSKEIMVRMTK